MEKTKHADFYSKEMTGSQKSIIFSESAIWIAPLKNMNKSHLRNFKYHWRVIFKFCD